MIYLSTRWSCFTESFDNTFLHTPRTFRFITVAPRKIANLKRYAKCLELWQIICQKCGGSIGLMHVARVHAVCLVDFVRRNLIRFRNNVVEAVMEFGLRGPEIPGFIIP